MSKARKIVVASIVVRSYVEHFPEIKKKFPFMSMEIANKLKERIREYRERQSSSVARVFKTNNQEKFEEKVKGFVKEVKIIEMTVVTNQDIFSITVDELYIQEIKTFAKKHNWEVMLNYAREFSKKIQENLPSFKKVSFDEAYLLKICDSVTALTQENHERESTKITTQEITKNENELLKEIQELTAKICKIGKGTFPDDKLIMKKFTVKYVESLLKKKKSKKKSDKNESELDSEKGE